MLQKLWYTILGGINVDQYQFQFVGLREKIQETPIFHGKIYGFRLRFSLESIDNFHHRTTCGPLWPRSAQQRIPSSSHRCWGQLFSFNSKGPRSDSRYSSVTFGIQDKWQYYMYIKHYITHFKHIDSRWNIATCHIRDVTDTHCNHRAAPFCVLLTSAATAAVQRRLKNLVDHPTKS